MALTLLFLGRLEDIVGRAEMTLDVHEPRALVALCAMLEPTLCAAILSSDVRIALNGQLIAAAEVCAGNGDELAFLPPVSGGCDTSNVRLSFDAFCPYEELRRFSERQKFAGGIVNFAGHVREETNDTVIALELRHFEPLTLPGMRSLAIEAETRWPLLGLLLIHRVGIMAPGDVVVQVACAARHRRDAFEAADFLMDHLKSSAWFWKREKTTSGWRWVEPREADYSDLARWTEIV